MLSSFLTSAARRMYRTLAARIVVIAAILVSITALTARFDAAANEPIGAEEIDCDLLIVGATESGWAAAIQAARMGVESITIVHDGRWIGGQFTEQALACVDENKGVGKVGWGVDWHPMKRSFHRSGLFKRVDGRDRSVQRGEIRLADAGTSLSRTVDFSTRSKPRRSFAQCCSPTSIADRFG